MQMRCNVGKAFKAYRVLNWCSTGIISVLPAEENEAQKMLAVIDVVIRYLNNCRCAWSLAHLLLILRLAVRHWLLLLHWGMRILMRIHHFQEWVRLKELIHAVARSWVPGLHLGMMMAKIPTVLYKRGASNILDSPRIRWGLAFGRPNTKYRTPDLKVELSRIPYYLLYVKNLGLHRT